MFTRSFPQLALPAAVAAIFVQSTASAITFTDRAVFEASLPAGSYFDNFSGVPDAAEVPVPSISLSGGTPAISYEITGPPAGVGVFPDAGFKAIGNWQPSNDVVVTFTSSNVFSAGASVWLSTITGVRVDGSITVDFSDGSTADVPSSSDTNVPFGFIGVTSTTPLTTMTIRASTAFLNFSNFSVAAGAAPVTGDYNVDGAVNAADYVVWRDTLGSTVNLAADGNRNLVVDQPDYGVWSANYGSGASTVVAVPEPTSVVTAAAFVAACAGFRRGRTPLAVAPLR
jgi:hypothetical protein